MSVSATLPQGLQGRFGQPAEQGGIGERLDPTAEVTAADQVVGGDAGLVRVCDGHWLQIIGDPKPEATLRAVVGCWQGAGPVGARPCV